MKKIKYNNVPLLWVCLMMIAGLAVSCDGNNNNSTNSGKVELLSFGPSGVQIGDTISFIGNNLDKVTAIVFTGDSVAKSSFLTQTPDLIKVIVPPLVQRGKVILRTPEGDVVSLTPIDFFVEMTLTGIETERPGWTTRPGSNITITGTNLNWIKQIDFYNKTNVIAITDTFFVSQSPTKIVVTVPLTAQTGQLALYLAGTKATKYVLQDNLNIVLPVITDMSPNPVYGGKDQLTITGTDLDLVTGIMLTHVTDTIKKFISHTATKIVIAPPAETAPGAVTLYPYSLFPSPSATPLNVVLPAITGLSPNPVARGSQLTITGTNLDLVTEIAMKGVPDRIKTFDSQSATQVLLTVPQEAIFGQVTVYSLAGVPIVSADTLAYVGDTAIDLWTGSVGPNGWSGNDLVGPLDTGLMTGKKTMGINFTCSPTATYWQLHVYHGSWWSDIPGWLALPGIKDGILGFASTDTNIEFAITPADIKSIADQGNKILCCGNGIIINKVYVK